MKYSIWFIGCLVIFSLIGCFDDKGTYDYKDLNEPIWNTGDGEPVINVTCRAGEVAKFRASPFFAWKGRFPETSRRSALRVETGWCGHR